MSDRGVFVVFEGVEGVGKSTQAQLFAGWLSELRIPHRLAREPGGTAVGEAIREVLLDARGPGMSAESELLLMLAARAAFVREVVRPTLESGAVMVADRFDLSTFAYQGVGRGLGIEAVKRLNRFATAGLRPDVVLVLDLSAAEGRARQLAQGKERDRIEGEGLAFLDRVRAAYRSLASDDPRAVLIDGSPPPEDVHLRVREALASRFPEPFGARGG